MAEHGGSWQSMAEHGRAWRSMAEHGGARLLTVTMVTVSPDFRFNSHLIFIALFVNLVISDKKEERGEEREKKKLVHITWQQH